MDETSYPLNSPEKARALRERQELASDTASFADQHFDVVIVGGGFAGTAAAVNLARANRKVCLVDAGASRNRNSEHMHGVIGLDATNPSALLARGHAEFVSYGGLLIDGRVETLEQTPEGDWAVKLESDDASTASQVLVATGITDVLPGVPGLEGMWGTRVFHCPYCHGYEAKGKNIGVVGGKNPGFTARIATLLTKWADSVTLYSNGMDLSPEQRERLQRCGVALNDDDVVQVSPANDDDHAVEITTETGPVRYDACFTGPEFSPNDALLRGAGCTVANGWVQVEGGRTSESGLWAVGNVVSSPDQVSQALGSGASVAIAIDQHLFDQI
ncbi:NAD(P)/FAD-dependent oxidoreductase [Corynebacterium wankanglinii]|uniref:NAD(P)/FAD-dependent oxidoreductase n=1 Tax=Corynebacterium wankanglinii TaxID=2735136 RepID=A0A838CM01_9CORY|nr:NAD(P)/FAD-dependent oxidoreductase [Corynebacterium wankanglinii]MBA1836261.1 NAD(P)/FAD-dependent oxidoreductase [Corynebacterium wankanglinii]